MSSNTLGRRAFLSATAASAVALAHSRPAAAAGPGLVSASGPFEFEVQRSDEEWREMLTDAEYTIMREGGTEEPQSSIHWDRKEPGSYHCKGCDLKVYDHEWKVVWKKGWVFFRHSEPQNVLLGVDRVKPAVYGGSGMAENENALIEAHCRRCGSHLGHVVMANLIVVHCINGAALNFEPAAA